MKRLTLTLLAVAGLALAACEEEEKLSTPPMYAGFTYEQRGDSLFVTAAQFVKGKYLNGTDYTFTLKGLKVQTNESTVKDSTLVYAYHTNYDGTDSGNPVGRFRIPDGTQRPCHTKCWFSAQFTNSGTGDPSASYSSMGGNTFYGTISSSSSALYSMAEGNVDIPIQ